MFRFAFVPLLVALLNASSQPAAALVNSNENVASSGDLPSNVVLVAVGGATDEQHNVFTQRVNIITIANNTHTTAARLPGNQATSFDGAVLNNVIYVVGSFHGEDSDNSTTARSALSYNVSANNWTRLSDFPFGQVYGNAVAALNDKVYSFGGTTDGANYMNSTYVYDPSKNTWQLLSTPLPLAREALEQHLCAVSIGNHSIYLLSDTYLLRTDDGAQTWNVEAEMGDVSPVEATCVSVDDTAIMVIGGAGSHGTSVYKYNLVGGLSSWQAVAHLSKSRYYPSAVSTPHIPYTVFVCGGSNSTDNFNDDSQADCEKYDTRANKWSPAQFTLDIPRLDFGLFAVTKI